MGSTLLALAFLAALGSGLIAGFFLAFSACVMAALGRIPPASGISAMQSVNVVVLNPVFLGTFFGTTVLSCACRRSAHELDRAWRLYLLAGSLLYLAGSILVTMICNVPLNNRLAAAEPDSAEGKAVWTHYLRVWTAWNQLRTAASLAAMACFILAFSKMWS
jgi:uncharacterized membrane protein